MVDFDAIRKTVDSKIKLRQMRTPKTENKSELFPRPLFEERAKATINRVTSVFGQRGTEYGDTWRNSQHLNAKAVARALGYKIAPEHFRALACAALCDVKYQRMEGGYKDDTVVDRIAYDSFLADEMAELLKTK